MRCFKFSFPTKKTQHPDGDKNTIVYAQGKHKKAATFDALINLKDVEGDNADFFKLPNIEEITHDQYLEAIEEIEAAKREHEETTEQALIIEANKSINTGCASEFTVNTMRRMCATIALYGLLDDYTDKANQEITNFLKDNNTGTREEVEHYNTLCDAALPYLTKLSSSLDHVTALTVANYINNLITLNIPDIDKNVVGYIVNDLGFEWEPDLPGITEEIETKNKTSVDIPPAAQTIEKPVLEAPEFNMPPPHCTFDADLTALNARLDALQVGEGFCIDNISNRLYHATNAISKSTLDIINRDPSLIQWAKNCPSDYSKERSLNIGTAFHAIVLEPENFERDYLLMPELNLRTNDGKAAKKEFEEKAAKNKQQIMSDDDNKQLTLMKKSVFAHPMVKRLLENGKAEKSYFYRYSKNIVLRIRCDWETVINGVTFIMDLKSTPDASKFEKSVDEYRYHVQDAFYSFVFEKVTGVKPVFCFCATGKAIELGRYPTRLVILDDYDKEVGLNAALKNVETYQECINTGVWGGFETIRRPNWARRQDEQQATYY